MAIVIYNDNGTIKVVKLGTYVVSTDANATESYTITWKAYDGTTLKTETKDYGSTSAAPIGTTDTVQYDYSWPQNSVVVTGPQTIQETRTIKSYTITWKAYDGTTLDSETLWYGETVYAPTGTADTAQYEYYWPKSSTTVVGNETITETRATKSYTITWKAYSGAIIDAETLWYGEIVYAPTGTADTEQYEYSWPKASTTVTGDETITETRTPRLHTSAPSISISTGPRDIYTMYRVWNNDTHSAAIYSDVETTPPTTFRGDIASGTQTDSISTGILKELSGGVIYARAQASGKTMSTISSLYME